MVRPSTLALWLVSCLLPLRAATLERLTIDDMIQKSTDIVRGTVTGSYTAYHGSVIYTHYKIQVTERWKGAAQGSTEVAVPGGTVGRNRQFYAGAPQFASGSEYLFFLWTSSKGLPWVIGFSQGVFELPKDPQTGEVLAVRNPTGETMLDPNTGAPVKPEAIQMRLRDLNAQVVKSLARNANK